MSDAQQPPKSIAELLTEIDANIETLEQQIDRLRSVRHILDDAAKNQTLSGHHLNAEALMRHVHLRCSSLLLWSAPQGVTLVIFRVR